MGKLLLTMMVVAEIPALTATAEAGAAMKGDLKISVLRGGGSRDQPEANREQDGTENPGQCHSWVRWECSGPAVHGISPLSRCRWRNALAACRGED